MNTLYRLGFKRISMGVQDLSADVQEAIGRNQSLEKTQQMMDGGWVCTYWNGPFFQTR
jgi:coproporphyrinogen III oxidase-like Fe-S oxidoreductase